jgi:hypothetical protein
MKQRHRDRDHGIFSTAGDFAPPLGFFSKTCALGIRTLDEAYVAPVPVIGSVV